MVTLVEVLFVVRMAAFELILALDVVSFMFFMASFFFLGEMSLCVVAAFLRDFNLVIQKIIIILLFGNMGVILSVMVWLVTNI